MISLRNRFDEIRATNPDCGFALYALEPHGPVTLEIHTPDGGLFTFKDMTAEAAIDQAFPPDPADTTASPPPAADPAPEPAGSIFD